ncbi:MAG: hypothetical protein U0996_21975 [Planctomycetaceae bacterium]
MPKASNQITEYCESIAETISDDRKGEIPTPDAKHVLRWARQFPVSKRSTILKETAHLFDRGYYSKENVREFLGGLIDNEELIRGQSPKSFWKRVNFLRLQGKGSSQEDLLNIFGGMLNKRFEFWTRDCGSKSGPHFYLDDFLFTGTTVRTSLLKWIEKSKPTKPDLHLVFIAYHRYGQYNAQTSTGKAISQVGGTVTYWRMTEIEDRKRFASSCDVLRPRKVYSDPAINATTCRKENHSLVWNGSAAEMGQLLHKSADETGIEP